MNRFVSGLLGGAMGLICMHYARRGATVLLGSVERDDGLRHFDRRAHARRRTDEETTATNALARKLSRLVAQREPSEQGKQLLANALHASLGLAMAALYAARHGPARSLRVALPQGALFGAAMWAVGDACLVPLCGLSRSPWRYPATAHLTTLAGHLGYGLGTSFGLRLAAHA